MIAKLFTVTTVLITGASSGLGEEFARQLAERGANLVLVARRIERLEQLAAELRSINGATVTAIECDLSTADAASTLGAELADRGIPVHSLVNNAGLASTAAYQPVPFMAVYGATKAFVLSFTEALWAEAQGTGLKVLALAPGATRTEFFDIAGAGAQVGKFRTPAEVVALALATLDRRNPPPSVIDGGMNRVTAFLTRLASRRFVAATTKRVMAHGLS